MEPQVILFVVEGDSDNEALMPWVEEELRKNGKKITVKIMNGDFLTAYKRNTRIYNVTCLNVEGQLKKMVTDFLKLPETKADQIRMTDIKKVYYVTDMDECFVGSATHSINKKECLIKMFGFSELKMNKTKSIEFDIIFFSQNLEDVICSNPNATREEKIQISTNFGLESLKNRETYIRAFNVEGLKVWKTYEESYSEIQNFHGRACNMNILISEIENGFLKIK